MQIISIKIHISLRLRIKKKNHQRGASIRERKLSKSVECENAISTSLHLV